MTYININNTLFKAEVIVDQSTINDETILPSRKRGRGAPKHHIFVKSGYYGILEKYYPSLFDATTHHPKTGVKETVKNYFKISSLMNDIERINSNIDLNKETAIDPATLLRQLQQLAISQNLVTEFYLESEISKAQNGVGFKNWQTNGISFGGEILKFFFHKTRLKVYVFKNGAENSTYWELDQSFIDTPNAVGATSASVRDPDSPRQIIYFGAPGSGKSHMVSVVLDGKESTTERVTFHPDFDYSSFVGGFKPQEGDDGNITYGFVPQIFTNMYVRAWEDLDRAFYLVIEEINRGNCAEIFGDIFQLLDRNPKYKVSPSNELKNYLSERLGFDHAGLIDGLMLPPNLSILATMNTSDQSLYPMDSAFKRRWDWEYVPINYLNDGNKSAEYQIIIDGDTSIKWIDFISVVNKDHILDNPNLGMDKCIGNYFIKPKEDNKISVKDFINKVIFYLWNDVFKDEDNTVFEEKTSYESFFPIETNGAKQVKLLMERLGLIELPNPN